MKTIRIEHPSNEASALLGIQNQSLLQAQGWKFGFWTASDEFEAGKALSILGCNGDGEWEVRGVKAAVSGSEIEKKVEDCECLARAGSWIYVFGSQYGSKEGPLEPKRHFVMRFNESLVSLNKKPRVEAHLARAPFLLHRLVNDAIREAAIKVLPTGEHLQHDMIERTIAEGKKAKKKWRELVRKDDVPINVEGATFLHGGHLLLGLRHPVTAEGHPLLIEIEGIDRLFDDRKRDPVVRGIRIIGNVGKKDAPSGIRELDSVRSVVHVITGSLESQEASAVVEDHPEGSRARSEHWIVPLQPMKEGVERVRGELVRRFKGSSVEGMALEGEKIWYVCDAEEIVLHVAELKSERST